MRSIASATMAKQMTLPRRDSVESEVCSGLVSGTSRLQMGNTTNSTIAATPIAIHSRCAGKRERRAAPTARFSGTNAAGISRFNGAALQREQSLRPLLNEDDDEDEHGDFRQYRALPRLQELVD